MDDAYLSDRLPDELPGDPMRWAEAWLTEASERGVTRNPNAMSVATVAADGQPSLRVVLCKQFVADPGYLVFYTNYQSRKVAELRANPRIAACFHWDALGRQVRFDGPALFSPAAESDAYFASRNPGSQLGAWGSDQSAPIATRDALLQQIRERAAGLGIELGDADTMPLAAEIDVPRPPHWGGIRIWPERLELWIEGADRVHERARWTRTLTPRDEHSFDAGPWTGERLQP